MIPENLGIIIKLSLGESCGTIRRICNYLESTEGQLTDNQLLKIYPHRWNVEIFPKSSHVLSFIGIQQKLRYWINLTHSYIQKLTQSFNSDNLGFSSNRTNI